MSKVKINLPKLSIKWLQSIIDLQSIRVQLTLALMIFTLLPLLVVSYLGYNKASEVLMEQLGESRIKQAQILADEVSLFVKETEKAVATIANLDDIRNFQDPKAQSRVMKELKKQYDSLEVIYIIDSNGKVLNMEPITNIGFSTNFAKDSWFNGVIKNGEAYLSDSTISDTTNKPMVFVAYPIFNEGQIVGVINGECDFAEYDYHGTMKISAFAPTEQGWGVFITQDKAEIMASLIGLSNQIILVVAIAVVLIFITGLWFAKSFTKPNRLTWLF